MSNKIILLATFQMTPSVNDMYTNIEPGTNKRKPNGGRKLKQQYVNLKEHLVNGLYNGFFLEGGIDAIHYIAKRYVDDIRYLYDLARFQKPTAPLAHRFSLDITVVHNIEKFDGDNRIKFIQDVVAKWIGIDDHQFNSVTVKSVYVKKCKPYVFIKVKHTDTSYNPEELIKQAFQELEFENITEKDFEELTEGL